MSFNSYQFILFFLPLTVAGYFLLNKIDRRLGSLGLIAAGAVFYLYAGLDSARIFALSIVISYASGFAMERLRRGRKLMLAVAVLANVALLGFFKYHDFYIDNFGWFAPEGGFTRGIFLPLGISFFTFQQIAWLVNVYDGSLERAGLTDYLMYIFFFPKLVMGPIVEPVGLISQLNEEGRRKPDPDNLASGAKVFSFGLFKKAVLADTLAYAVSWGFGDIAAVSSLDMLLVMLSYTFQLYFDFSGYTDMATGLAKMLNIELPINFDSPYRCSSIGEFWKHWHITLSDFLTKYIYFPLGGSRRGKLRSYLNIMAVFFVSGLWHGANWTFILWGLCHGLLNVLERVFARIFNKLPGFIRWLYTFAAVNILLMLFNSQSIHQWKIILLKFLRPESFKLSESLVSFFAVPEMQFISDVLHLGGIIAAFPGFWLVLMLAVSFGLCLIPRNNYRSMTRNSPASAVLAALAFVWGFISLGGESSFVYFGF